jgi:hypothetical protein
MPDPAAIKAAQAAIAAATNGTGEQPWEAPVPIDRHELPKFPVHALPLVIGNYVQALADETQTPLDLAGSLSLAVVASTIQRRYVVEIRPRYREQLSLWTLGLLDSAERKSTVYASMLWPVYHRQAELIANGGPERARALAELASAEKRQDKATRDAASAKREDMSVAICARDEAVENVERLKNEIPPEAVLLLDDVTPEQFAVILSDVGSVCIASPEGGVFGNFFGRYNSKLPNLDGLLKSHSGDDMAIDRKNGTKLTICSPACTFAMVVQPDVLIELARKQEWTERGGSARFLYVMPKGNVGRRNGNGHAMQQQVEDEYRRRVLEMLPSTPPTTRADRKPEPFVMRFDAEARKAWEKFERQHEPRLHPETGDLGWCRSWGGKFAGQLARLAAQFQFVEHGPSDVGIEAMQRALEFAPYFEAHAVAALTAANEKPGVADARQALRWIETTRPETFTTRDLYRANFGRDKTLAAERADEACKVLDAHGYIRATPGARTVDSGRWQPHPILLGGGELSEVSDISESKIKRVDTTLPSTYGSVEPNHEEGPPSTDRDSGVSECLTLLTVEDERAARFAPMPDLELDQIAHFTTQQIVDQEHRDQRKNGKPDEHPRDVLPPIPAEAFAEHAKTLPFVEDEESFTAEPVDWDKLEAEEAEADA